MGAPTTFRKKIAKPKKTEEKKHESAHNNWRILGTKLVVPVNF